MLIGERIIERGVLALNDEPGEVISDNILHPRFIFNLQIKLLQEQDPPDKVRLHIFLLKEVLENGVVGVHYHLRA